MNNTIYRSILAILSVLICEIVAQGLIINIMVSLYLVIGAIALMTLAIIWNGLFPEQSTVRNSHRYFVPFHREQTA